MAQVEQGMSLGEQCMGWIQAWGWQNRVSFWQNRARLGQNGARLCLDGAGWALGEIGFGSNPLEGAEL